MSATLEEETNRKSSERPLALGSASKRVDGELRAENTIFHQLC